MHDFVACPQEIEPVKIHQYVESLFLRTEAEVPMKYHISNYLQLRKDRRFHPLLVNHELLG